jgi:hypothetical protein
MTPRTVTLALSDIEPVTFRVLDSSDGMEKANVHLQEVLLWSTYIRRFHELYFPRAESREELLEMGALMALPVLLSHGLEPDVAEDAGQDLAEEVLDRLLPGDLGEARMPGPTTFERLAEAMEYRRQALRKLFGALAPRGTDPTTLDQFVDVCRNWDLAMQLLDALMTGEWESDEDQDGEGGDGADSRADSSAGESPLPQPETDMPGPGDAAGSLAGSPAPGTVDVGGDVRPGLGTPERGGSEAAEDMVRPADASHTGGVGELAGDGRPDRAAQPEE